MNQLIYTNKQPSQLKKAFNHNCTVSKTAAP